MNCGRDKAMKTLAELDTKKGIGLIERVKQGFGKPDIIYVKNFILRTSKDVKNNDESEESIQQNREVEEVDLSESEKSTYRGRKNRLQGVGKTDFKRSENTTYRGRKIRTTEVGKTDPNNTNYNYTDISNTAMAIFDVANHVVSNAGGMITGSASIDVTEALKTLLETQIEDMGIGELLGLGLETMLVSLCLKIISVLITVILYGRMIEIYLYVSVAPIPFSTFTNREWGSIGNNYVKALLALGFQGFFMMVCVAIYAVLVNAITVADNLHTAIWSVAAYTVILCFSLFKTSSLAKSIFNAH